MPADADQEQVDAALTRISTTLLDEVEPATAELTAPQRARLEIVAGRYPEALQTVGALVASMAAEGEVGRAQRWTPYLLLAEARATPGRFEQAYADAFRARFAELDDLAALQTHYWFVADTEQASDQLRETVSGHAGAESIPRDAALELVRQAAFLQTYRAAGAMAPALVREDEERRFVVDDEVMIPGGAEGVVLSAHVVRSRSVETPVPAAMLFTIYADPERNRGQAMQAAARGYVGVVVDARGKRLGTGEVAPYEHEGEDAHAAIDWIGRQPWCDGRVAMYGGSYSGFAAWAAAGRRPPALKAIAPYVASIPGLGLPMENNVFLSANYAWPFYVATNRLLDHDTYGQRGRWAELAERWYASGRPYREIDRVDGTPNPWLQRWLSHPDYDAYWKAMVPDGEEFAKITIPVLSITGYFDDAQVSALHYFKEHVRYLPDADHTLLIGPYDHFGTQGPIKAMRLREYALDPSAQFDTLAVTFQWFDHVLRGTERPPLLAGRVNYQLMGADRWGHAASLDEAAGGYASLHLSGEGEGARHRLSRRRPRPGHLTQVVDLADRTSSRHGYYPSPIVRDTLDIETGLAFVSEPFERSIDVVGTLSGELKVRTNKRDFDFTVVLYELMKDGRTMQLSYYLGRASHAHDMSTRRLLEPGEWTTLPFDRSRMTGRRMAPGSRLLVVVDVVKDAMHQVNHGTGGDVSDESIADAAEPLRVDWHSDSVVRVPMRPNAR